MPTACAAMPMRPPSRVDERDAHAAAGARRARSPGVASKARSAVDEEFSPIFSSSRVTLKPSAPRRTTKALASSGSLAKAMNVWA